MDNRRFVYDTYRRFIQLFGKVVLGVDDEEFSKLLEGEKKRRGVLQDSELDVDSMKPRGRCIQGAPAEGEQAPPTGTGPTARTRNRRCIPELERQEGHQYRRQYRIGPDVAKGTAVTIVSMVFGNMGNDSATGVLFMRDPSTGGRGLYGDYLTNAQGEDVVAGIRTPKSIAELKDEMPQVYLELDKVAQTLEGHYREPQDIEFTIERGKLYLLQTRAAKMGPMGAVRAVVDMVHEGTISKEEALLRIAPEQLEQLMHPRVDPENKDVPIAVGVPAARSGEREGGLRRRHGGRVDEEGREGNIGEGGDETRRRPWVLRREGY